jgi:diguanylate cyclase (GGDEF)-like protein/PAS domain S-box-containing protein
MKELAILCVDDENTILHAITEEIRDIVDEDIIIESALNASEALEVCEEFYQDDVELALVISDCIMPGMQGDKLLEEIHKNFPYTYKVMLTGQAELDAVQYAINNANLFRYLTKPWDKDDMKLTVLSAIEGFKKHLELEGYKKELERKVEDRTNELKQAIHIVHEYAYHTLVDKNGIILESSNSFAKMCGIPKNELVGKSLFDTFATNSRNDCIEGIKKSLGHGHPFECEIEQNYLDFLSTWVDLTITPIADERYDEVVFSIKRHDINDKKYIQKLVDTDVLTSLFNRRFFNSLFPKEIKRVQREKKSFAFLMIDIDYFKKYNDTYGHQKGDDALVSFSRVLNQTAKRGADFPFRLGGEEFAIITTDITEESLLAYANSINKKLYELQIEHKQNIASPYLSCSIGVIFYEDGNIKDDMDTIIRIADELLYKAKQQGRNQVVLEKR